MLKFWSVNYVGQVCKLYYMSEILDNIHIWVLLVNSECVLLLAVVKYTLCSHFTQNCIFFLSLKIVALWQKIVENFLYLCIYFLQKMAQLISQKSLYFRKLPDSSVNCIRNALWIGVQYTLSLLILAWSAY